MKSADWLISESQETRLFMPGTGVSAEFTASYQQVLLHDS